VAGARRRSPAPALRIHPPQRPDRSLPLPPPSSQASPASTAPLTPAVLPGTPAAFLIPADRLVALAKAAFATQTGVDDDSVLAPDFRFEFPVVSLDREAYLKAVRGFGLKEALPDLQPHAYDWRVDPFEPNRVWYTIRTTATHTGTLRFGRSEYKATGRQVLGAPECCSYCFDDAGKVVAFTGGYVMDRRVGNTGGLGALFGILHGELSAAPPV
jgi:hypothetical protein